MAMSFSRPDPASPAQVADASFSTGRRGFDQTEVRDFLRMVSAELGRLRERETFLERELVEAQNNPDLDGSRLDDEALTRLLGEETARVLNAARESAHEIREKAEQSAARILLEASDEATRMREEAEIEASRRRTDATADAEAELSMAKQQGREMVTEARAYRERVLSELARRRELAREQIEQLVHGRDRLMQAFERARLVAVDVVAEMQPLGEPDEYVDLTPSTGPVPVMVAREGSGNAGDPADRTADSADAASSENGSAIPVHEPSADDLHVIEDLDGSTDGEETADAGGAAETGAGAGAGADADAHAEEPEAADADVFGDVEDAGAGDDPAGDSELDPAEVAADDADDPAEDVADVSVEDAGDASGDASDDVVVDLFARLRADSTADDVLADDNGAQDDDISAQDETRDGDDRRDDVGAAEETGTGTDKDTGTGTDNDTESSDETATSDDTAAAEVTQGADASHADDADQGDAGQGDAAEGDAAQGDDVFHRRDADLTPLIVSSARKLKRVLADEQNEVLDALRRNDPVLNLDGLLPWSAEHLERYASVIGDDLLLAATAGAGLADPDTAGRGKTARLRKAEGRHAVAEATEKLGVWLVQPLRDRLERCVSEGGGDNAAITKKVRAVYRECKTRHIDEQLDDVIRVAHGRGLLGALELDTPVVWTPDTRHEVCADCDDNRLAGAVAAGQPFPTGQVSPPAHPACRCMLVPVAR